MNPDAHAHFYEHVEKVRRDTLVFAIGGSVIALVVLGAVAVAIFLLVAFLTPNLSFGQQGALAAIVFAIGCVAGFIAARRPVRDAPDFTDDSCDSASILLTAWALVECGPLWGHWGRYRGVLSGESLLSIALGVFLFPFTIITELFSGGLWRKSGRGERVAFEIVATGKQRLDANAIQSIFERDPEGIVEALRMLATLRFFKARRDGEGSELVFLRTLRGDEFVEEAGILGERAF